MSEDTTTEGLRAIRITPNGFGLKVSIEVDGQPIRYVRTVRYENVAGEVPTLTLELIPTAPLVIEGLARVNGVMRCLDCQEKAAQLTLGSDYEWTVIKDAAKDPDPPKSAE